METTTLITIVLGGCLTLVAGLVLLRSPKKKDERKPDVVYLHQFPSPKDWPNYSPFCLKLETYLRLSGTPFVDVRALENGPHGKQPWVEWNGEAIPDSDTVIARLEQSPSDKAKKIAVDPPAAHLAKRCIEEHVYWAVVHSRWIEQTELTAQTFFPDSKFMQVLAKRVMKPSIAKSLKAHGLGRHPRDELYRRATDDLRAISRVLGDAKFLAGDLPCSADASLFGLVANILWCPFASPLKDLLVDDASVANLRAHADRVRDLAWGAEWDAKGYRRE